MVFGPNILNPGLQASAQKENFVQFEDLSSSTYRVLIGRVQQLALQKAGGPVPLPAQQLELLAKKKGKEQRTRLSSLSLSIWGVLTYVISIDRSTLL